MFGSSRRHRQPLTTAPPNSNAAAAASAAAAALRARPMTPTRVADVQTERTLRRSTSVASSAASSEPQGRPALNRRGSSGSMTDRTFRSPSPHRPPSSASGHRHTQSLGYTASEEAPPVPALPQNMAPTPQQHAQPHRRATSLGVTNTAVRLASQTLASNNAPSWFGAAKLGDPRNARRTDPAMASPPSSPPRVAQEAQQGETGRPSSRASSINFSYPTRLKVGSPPASPVDTRKSVELPPQSETQAQVSNARPERQARQSKSKQRRRIATSEPSQTGPGPTPNMSDQVLVYDPNSRRMVRQADLRAVELSFPEVSAGQTSPKRKKQAPQRAGSHLAKGTMGRSKSITSSADQHPRALPANADVPTRSPQTQPRSVVGGQQELAVSDTISSPRIEAQPLEQLSHPSVADPPASMLPQQAVVATAVHHPAPWETKSLKRLPSIVREEPEPDSEPEKTAPLSISEALDAVPSRSRVHGRVRSEAPDSPEQTEASPGSAPAISSAATPPDEDSTFTDGAFRPERHVGSQPLKLETPQPIQPANHDRTNSVSPVRQAHFGSVSSKLTVRHSPPPRSISPRKSALKHSSSPSRGASPSDDTSEASGGVVSREEIPVSRKKSVRVSFDDGNTVVTGESASLDRPHVSSATNPQHPVAYRPWHHTERSKELPPLDDEIIMKPRPALPSFGSVRDRKPRDTILDESERPLVRPAGERFAAAPTPKYAFASGDPYSELKAVSQGKDHTAGAIAPSEPDDRSKIAANTSRFREPLPPVVTSVEGGGYMSDSTTSSESEESRMSEVASAPVNPDQPPSTEPQIGTPTNPPNGTAKADGLASSPPAQSPEQAQNMAVPVISISQPTPPIAEKRPVEPAFFDVPGGFPLDDSDVSAEVSGGATLTSTAQTTEAPSAGFSAPLESGTDSETSIYSDAYEDLSEVDGVGFQSLDAVLERGPLEKATPSASQTPRSVEAAVKQPLPLDSIKADEKMAAPATNAVAQPTTQDEEWEKVKAYWRSLSNEKRLQLEKEALEEAGVEADLEEAKPETKPKKKKSVERRNSERKALVELHAQQVLAQQQKEQMEKPVDRSYQIKPGTKWPEIEAAGPSMRTSLRPGSREQPASGSNTPRLRKSMRTNGAVTHRQASVEPTLTKSSSQRPMSSPISSQITQRRETSEIGLQAQAESQKQQRQPVPIKRRGSTSSESSFKRSRPTAGGHFTGFRTTMRQPSPSSSQVERPSSKRFSLRSLSPAGSSFKPTDAPPVSMGTSSHMRQTLRDSSNERKKGSSAMRMPNFSLSGGSKKAGKRASDSRLSSRFADSSDEDTGTKSGFRSRFEDSSDDEAVSPIAMPKALPTALGQLRNQESLASTALPEELEESEGSPERKESSVPAQPSQTGPLPEPLATQPTQPQQPSSGGLTASTSAPVVGTAKVAERRNSKRGSILSALRRKRHDSAGKISRDVTESAARTDTKLERHPSRLRGIRRSGEVDAEESVEDEEGERVEKQATGSPKLQKRVRSMRRSVSAGHVPVAEEIPSPLALPSSVTGESTLQGSMIGHESLVGIAVDEKQSIRSPLRRPSMASGNLGTRTMSSVAGAQPSLMGRRTMSAGVLSVDAPSTVGTEKKKKKFGALRRMFGLDD